MVGVTVEKEGCISGLLLNRQGSYRSTTCWCRAGADEVVAAEMSGHLADVAGEVCALSTTRCAPPSRSMAGWVKFAYVLHEGGGGGG